MATANTPVETAHDRILSKLLVHFGADEIGGLPTTLKPVVQDVYDVAQDLAASKLKYQCEVAQLRLELERIRAQLAAERAARVAREKPAHRSTVSTSKATVTAAAMAGSRAKLRGNQPPPSPPSPAQRTPSIAATEKRTIPCRGRNGRITANKVVATPSTKHATIKQQRGLPPCLEAKKPRGSTPSRLKKTMTLTKTVPLVSGPVSAPSSTVSRPVATLTASASGVKSAPVVMRRISTRSTTSTRRPVNSGVQSQSQNPDRETRACLVVQITSERRLRMLQMKLDQLVQWKATYVDGQLRVCVGPTGSILKGVRSYSIDEIKAALHGLLEEAADLLEGCTHALGRVADGSSDKPWLSDRHAMLEETQLQLEQWVCDVIAVLDKFPPLAPATTVGKHRTPISLRVWNDIKLKLNYVSTANVKVDALRGNHAMPHPGELALTEIAVCSFVAHALGTFSISSIRGADYGALTQIGVVARELEWLVDRCDAAHAIANEKNEDYWRVTKSLEIFTTRHGASLKAIQRRATVCSEAICGVTNRIRDPAATNQVHYATSPASTSQPQFPGSTYTWEFYDDIVLGIVSCHVTLTRVAEVPALDRAAALFKLIKRLDELVEAMAPWADPRFDQETTTRSFEKHEYLKLMDWCERMCDHVARYDCHFDGDGDAQDDATANEQNE